MKLVAAALVGLFALGLSTGVEAAERGECFFTSTIWRTETAKQLVRPDGVPVEVRGMTQSFEVPGPDPVCAILNYSLSDVPRDPKPYVFCTEAWIELDGNRLPAAGDFRPFVILLPGTHRVRMMYKNSPCRDGLQSVFELGNRYITIQR